MSPYVLVVDAEPDLERQVRAELADTGWSIRTARDGRIAQDVMAEFGPPSLLVANLALPKRDGFALVRDLRGNELTARIPVVVVSAFPRMCEAAEAMTAALGPLFVQRKPLAIGSLAPLLREDTAGALPDAAPSSVKAMRAAADAAEKARIARMLEMGVLDDGAPPDPELQSMVAAVAAKFGVPVALVTLVLEKRQWFKSHAGLEGQLLAERGTPRDWAFCSHVVDGRAPLVVPDARTHPVFADNPLVLDGTVTGYAGAPLTTSNGDVLGTLCIIDRKPLEIGPDEVRALVKEARRVAGELEVRALRKTGLPSVGAGAAGTPVAFQVLEAAVSALDVGLVVFDARRHAVLATPAIQTFFGVDRHALAGKTRDEFVRQVSRCFAHPSEDVERLQVTASGPWVLREEIELVYPRSRLVRWVGRPLVLPDGVGQMISVTDVTFELGLARTQERLARHDALTGILNRRGAEEALARESSRSRRSGAPLAVALIDVDAFKRINDTLGHAAGDEVLARVVSSVQSGARGIDVVARWGGDELLVLLPGAGLEGARAFAERVRAAVAADGGRDAVPVTLSIGVAEKGRDESTDALLARADAALYEAKRLGRNRVGG